MSQILFKEASYQIIGICMDIYNTLGIGFREAVYKEAIEIEFKNHHIIYEREKPFAINYKGRQLKHRYPADFIVWGEIILEIKVASCIIQQHIAQTINYLKASHLHLGIIINFGNTSLEYKRIVL